MQKEEEDYNWKKEIVHKKKERKEKEKEKIVKEEKYDYRKKKIVRCNQWNVIEDKENNKKQENKEKWKKEKEKNNLNKYKINKKRKEKKECNKVPSIFCLGKGEGMRKTMKRSSMKFIQLLLLSCLIA